MTYEDALAILRDGWPITPEDLTQIAADIWDEGWGQGMAYVAGMERGDDDDVLDHAITNPYKETA